MKVYKIIQSARIDKLEKYQKGYTLPFIATNPENVSEEKKQIEAIFEDVRKKEFPLCPGRHDKAFFVFESLDFEKSWLTAMSKYESIKYLLVEIETQSENISWFNVDYFENSFGKDEQTIRANAQLYWDSKTNSPNNKGEYEGLLEGDNKVVSCTLSYWDHINRKCQRCKTSTRGNLTIEDIDFDDLCSHSMKSYENTISQYLFLACSISNQIDNFKLNNDIQELMIYVRSNLSESEWKMICEYLIYKKPILKSMTNL